MLNSLLMLPLLLAPSQLAEDPIVAKDLQNLSRVPGVLLLEDLKLEHVEQEWSRPGKGTSVDGNPLRIGEMEFQTGVGSHAMAEFVIALSQSALRFQSVVGVDSEVGDQGSVVFSVLVDGKLAAKSPLMLGSEKATHVFDVDLRGAEELVLLCEDGGDNINYDHADWGGARLLLEPSATAMPKLVKFPDESAPNIIHELSKRPQIHAPRIVGTTPGRPFLFRIPVSGKRPLFFSAYGLPDGLKLDTTTGILTGTVQEAGEYNVSVSVDGVSGNDKSILQIIAGENKLALTPPMGWNSWNVWGLAVDDAKVRAAADWLDKSGLADAGYSYINIDDAWEDKRDENGVLQPNDRFPDMPALAEYVHSKGLKLGIYSSPGEWTCGGYAGSLGYEELDAQTWADWGIDYLKYDWCSYFDVAKDRSLFELEKPYHKMRKALDATERDIVYSLCQYGMGDVSTWGANVGGNLWRTTGDITDTWASMSGIGFGQAGLESYAGPGHWNDPDMLVVGRLGWGPSLHDTKLTQNEQITHMTLWALLSAPLLIGCDLTAIDDFTLAVLTNPEVIEINQAANGVQAARVFQDGDFEVWAKELPDGSHAVGMFNRGRRGGDFTLNPKWLGLGESFIAHDSWRHKLLGKFEGSLTHHIPRHGALLLRVK